MDEPPVTPTFPPKRGLTEEEQRKVKAYIRKRGVTKCPAVGSPELAAINVAKYREWLAKVGMAMKIKLGFLPLKRPERMDKERRERKKEQEREWYRKKKEQKRARADH